MRSYMCVRVYVNNAASYIIMITYWSDVLSMIVTSSLQTRHAHDVQRRRQLEHAGVRAHRVPGARPRLHRTLLVHWRLLLQECLYAQVPWTARGEGVVPLLWKFKHWKWCLIFIFIALYSSQMPSYCFFKETSTNVCEQNGQWDVEFAPCKFEVGNCPDIPPTNDVMYLCSNVSIGKRQ